MFGMLWYTRGNQRSWPYQEIKAKDGTLLTWIDKVFLPNSLRFIAGSLTLLNSFIIILQSDNVLDLFKDFTALFLISDIDNRVFDLASQSYFGEKLKDESDKISKVKVVDNHANKQKLGCIPVHQIVFFVICASMVGGWSHHIHDGQFQFKKFKQN